MKKIYSLLVAVLVAFSVQSQIVNDSITMGQGYAEDVYYSFKDGVVSNSPRATWDIAFSTQAFSASILANTGANVAVWEYPSLDTTLWNSIDTTGMSTWAPIYNADTTWEEGAFNQGAAGHPDYGWCMYNSLDHNLYGYKIFIIKTHDGNYKKLWIKMKYSMLVSYTFVYANLDNSNETLMTLDASVYPDKNFVYYDFTTEAIVDREPVSAEWDVVFTRYWDMEIPYMVVGLLQNYDVTVAQVDGVDLSFSDTTGLVYSESIKTIGSDWKAFNMGTMSYTTSDTTVYFVKTAVGEIYKLYFTGYSGTSTGKSFFTVETIQTVGIHDINNQTAMSIYPNPSQGNLFINAAGQFNGKDIQVSVFNTMGQEVYNQVLSSFNENSPVELPASLKSGMYLIQVNDGKLSWGDRIILQ